MNDEKNQPQQIGHKLNHLTLPTQSGLPDFGVSSIERWCIAHNIGQFANVRK
jgi:hypothetical protein